MTSPWDQIHELEARRAEAIVQGDVVALHQITSNAYQHIDACGQLRGKEAFLDSLSDGEARYTLYRVTDNTIVLEGDVAIVTGRFYNEQVQTNGTIISKSGRHVRVYVRRIAGWRNIVHQGTEIIS
ncbi:nuclear transport factor 2 family protein [Bradyrhizobium sp. Pha-3]|uniref:nuclear transport factor 2 family protein n=1 Tax=Bradyrhizobium sp. Pha-3 TaxID=208375 RepID=UPI0035D42C1B